MGFIVEQLYADKKTLDIKCNQIDYVIPGMMEEVRCMLAVAPTAEQQQYTTNGSSKHITTAVRDFQQHDHYNTTTVRTY